MSPNITGNFIVALGNDPISFFQDNHWPLISITSITTKAPSGVIRYLVIVQTMTLADQTEILTNSHCLLCVITSTKSHVYVMKWSTKVPMYLKAAISQSLVSVGGRDRLHVFASFLWVVVGSIRLSWLFCLQEGLVELLMNHSWWPI